ncbi:hypothetical protein BC940DRAFT_124460 [Gongronella butleri]|nr:hypothetical protein BC940DRAFT_124460 [Gongronella butleri]
MGMIHDLSSYSKLLLVFFLFVFIFIFLWKELDSKREHLIFDHWQYIDIVFHCTIAENIHGLCIMIRETFFAIKCCASATIRGPATDSNILGHAANITGKHAQNKSPHFAIGDRKFQNIFLGSVFQDQQ